MNINTISYWDNRFRSNDWELKDGRIQTTHFALSQISKFNINKNFNGTILDFGCGLGDAIPVYRSKYPAAKFIGMDISSEAIDLCNKRYYGIAVFFQGDYLKTPEVDVIISSNVFEHLSDDLKIAIHLRSKCEDLYIIVPYKEKINPGTEHVNSYDEKYFKSVGDYEWKIFPSLGWSQYGAELYYHGYLKNIFRFFLGKKIVRRKKQIMYHFANV